MQQIIITEGLLTSIQDAFPNKLPENPVSQEEICVLIGQQQVIQWLFKMRDEIVEASYERQFHVTT